MRQQVSYNIDNDQLAQIRFPFLKGKERQRKERGDMKKREKYIFELKDTLTSKKFVN